MADLSQLNPAERIEFTLQIAHGHRLTHVAVATADLRALLQDVRHLNQECARLLSLAQAQATRPRYEDPTLSRSHPRKP